MDDDRRLPAVLTELGHDFRAAAERQIEIERAAAELDRRRRWPRRRRNALAFAVGALVCAGAGAGASGLLNGDEGRPLAGDRLPPAVRPAADPGVVASSATPDPAGGLPWAVKVFTNASGQDCVAVGRLRGGTLGRLARGTFRPFPVDIGGTCGDLTREPLLAALGAMPGTDPRTVVYGIARDRRPVTVLVAGHDTIVAPRGQGVFIVVRRGFSTHAQVSTHNTAGRNVRHVPG